MTQSGSIGQVYTTIGTTVTTTVLPRTIARSEQIALYFTEDLERFVAESHIDLIQEFDIPPVTVKDNREVIRLLFDDLTHLLRNSLITGIHLLLSEPHVDKNTHHYPLRYHAEYVIDVPARDIRPDQGQYSSQRINGYLQARPGAWRGAKFALLIDWNSSTSERRRHARRPEYWFDWTPHQEQFDATTLVRYREGGMAFDGASVISRFESTAPGF